MKAGNQVNVELRKVRQAAWLEQALRVPGVRGVPIYARGRDASAYRPDYSPDELISLRGASARLAKVYGIGGPSYRPVDGTTEAPQRRLASDWARAVVDAGLADIDGTRTPGLYLVYPEMASADWSELRHLSDYVPPVHVPAMPDQATIDQVMAELPDTLVPVRVMQASAINPGGYNRTARKLERAASLFFASRGEHHAAPDVFNQRHRRYHVRPDRVAFRGVKRAPMPTACRYERQVTDQTSVNEAGTIELLTRLSAAYYCHCAEQGGKGCACDRTGWRGHRRVTFPRPIHGKGKQAKRDKAKAARVDATGTRGKAVTAWTMSERSLARASARVAGAVAVIDTLLRRNEGTTVTFPDGTVVTVLAGGQVRDSHRERAYPVREWSRRAALAGLTIEQ